MLLYISLAGCSNADTDETLSDKTLPVTSVTDISIETTIQSVSVSASATAFATAADVTETESTVAKTTSITSDTSLTTVSVTATEPAQTQGTVTTEHKHTFGDWAVTAKASCTEKGKQTRICTYCGEEEMQTIKAIGHTWGSWKTIKEATVQNEGESARYCSVCGAKETRSLPKLRAPEPSDSKKLMEILKNNGYTLSDLSGSKQCIVVASGGSQCKVYLFEKAGDIWKEVSSTSGTVGKNGVSSESREGDYRTPKGLFTLGFAFGTKNITDLHIPYRRINDSCYWVDDPSSEYYNQWVETDDIQWASAEHLADYPDSYRYAVVINYNMDPIVPGAGSAIFLHCKTGSYTAGCVAVPEADMLDILYWLDSDAAPVILIS